MGGLSRDEYEGLVALAQAALDADDTIAWWNVFADLALGSLLHADVVAVADIDHRDGARGTFGLIRPAWAELAVPNGSEMHVDLLAHHPMTAHLESRRALEVVRVSDLMPETEWRSTAGYSKQRELIGATHQLNITIEISAQRTLSTSPIRAGYDFTDHDVQVARRLEPVLRAADRHTSALQAADAGRTPAELERAGEVAAGLRLTNRERVVLSVMSRGSTSRAVAHALAISPRTVEKHQENIYRKLGVSDRLTAVLRAQSLGLLPVGGRPRSTAPHADERPSPRGRGS